MFTNAKARSGAAAHAVIVPVLCRLKIGFWL
jgi:hypothetical protein